jgi:hypothetical protein
MTLVIVYIIIIGMNVVDNLNSVWVINKPCVCSRTMRLFTFCGLCRDQEQSLSMLHVHVNAVSMLYVCSILYAHTQADMNTGKETHIGTVMVVNTDMGKGTDMNRDRDTDKWKQIISIKLKLIEVNILFFRFALF